MYYENKIRGIIFDFDGVIVHSVQVKSDAFADLYEGYGEKIVKKVVDHHERNGGMSRFEKFKYYSNNFLKKPISEKEINILAKTFSKIVTKKVIESNYVEGAIEYIKKMHRSCPLFISTGTPTDEIKNILDARGIRMLFNSVYGSPEKKDIHIDKILSLTKINHRKFIFFGDSNSDVEAAEKKSIPFILIKNNFNHHIQKYYKGKMISNFNDLL